MSVNRLAQETSPYLLQHADNPVDWYPWGEEAFAKARAEDKPVLLSVGYAACHWCHVMEHESFEDDETAALMNERFVSVKVDREERPDVDSLYMDAVVALTGHGGWPMTVFLTPDGEPFLGGTYYPPEPRHGLPSFRQVLVAVSEAFRDRRADVATQASALVEAVSREVSPSADPLTESLLGQATRNLRAQFDAEWGGWGGAPKFPQPSVLEFLLRMHLRGDDDALPMVTATLDAMAAGGMYDLLGGGFHRYSVDRQWLVPHFEKMLYDNALLAPTYLHAWVVTGEERYRRVAEETLDYLLRELRLPEGGFASAQDADTDGVEGLTFTWTPEEGVREELLQPFEHGRSIIRGELDDDERRRLFELREQRPKPARDDKAIAAWNGLALAALAEAGRRLERDDYLDAARELGEFLLGPLSTEEGACTGRSAPARRRARATSRTTRTSRTGCSSCTSRPASCAGSRRRTGWPASPSSSSPTRSAAASTSRRPTASSSSPARRTSRTSRRRRATRCSPWSCSGCLGSTATRSSSGARSGSSGSSTAPWPGCRSRSATRSRRSTSTSRPRARSRSSARSTPRSRGPRSSRSSRTRSSRSVRRRRSRSSRARGSSTASPRSTSASASPARRR